MTLNSIQSQITHSNTIGQRNAYIQNHKTKSIHNLKSQYSINPKIKSNSFNVSSKERNFDFSIKMGLADFFTNSQSKSQAEISIEALKNELLNIIKGKYVGSLTLENQEKFYEIVSKLIRIGPRNPTRSPLFYGKFKNIYSTLSIGPGELIVSIYPDKSANIFFETSKFGFKVSQGNLPGTIKIINSNRYQITYLNRRDGIRFENGRNSMMTNTMDILYLDENLKIEKEDRARGNVPETTAIMISIREFDEEKIKKEPEIAPVATKKIIKEIISKSEIKPKELEKEDKMKELINELDDRVKIAQQTSKEIITAIKNVERDNVDLLKDANALNLKIKGAELACENVESEIKEVLENEESSQEKLKQSKLELQELQNQLLKL